MKKCVQRSKIEKYLEPQTSEALKALVLDPLTALNGGDHSDEDTELNGSGYDADDDVEEIPEESCAVLDDCCYDE